MGRGQAASETGLSVSGLLEIDRICRKFEAELKAGKEPQIEAFLGEMTEPQRSQLRQDWRRSPGKTRTAPSSP